MRILHTSDWHLGKHLEGYSRLEEQEKFMDELVAIAEEKEIDVVLVAGDVYDTVNPPAQAEHLFYNGIKRLSKGGTRAVLVIAGNHDGPERLMAAGPLAYEHGVILMGKPKSMIPAGKYGSFEITGSGEGYLRLKMKKEEAVILTLPYPSEKRLNEILTLDDNEEIRRKSYSERVGEIFQSLSKHYEKNTINLAVSHLYTIGGEESQSERQIQLGGSLAVDGAMLPDAQYIALGHLHKPQKVWGTAKKAYYSGSPLQYSKSEIHYSKCVYVVDVKPGQEAVVEEVYLTNYKPIEVWKCDGIEEAINRCMEESQRDIWVYLEIKTDRVLTQAEIKTMKEHRKDIVAITPVFAEAEDDEVALTDYREMNIEGLFEAYYSNRYGTTPPEDLMGMFYHIVGEEGEEIEAQITED